jgi:hypothetical protein
VEQVDQVERASPVDQILIVLRWVDYPVRRVVAGLQEIQANMELQVKMAILVRQTVRLIQPWKSVGKRPAAPPNWNQDHPRHTALRGTGFGISVTTIQRGSIWRMSDASTHIMQIVRQNPSPLSSGHASK